MLRVVETPLEDKPQGIIGAVTRWRSKRRKSPPKAKSAPPVDHCCDLDEIIAGLQRIRQAFKGKIGVMLSFDRGETGAAVPYMPVSQTAVDDDDPNNVVALLCVAEGNHPFGDVIKLRSTNWSWKP